MAKPVRVVQHSAMGKQKTKDLPDLKHLALPGGEVVVRVTPKAARNAVILGDEGLRVTVTAVPENGKATEAVRRLLSRAMGVAPSDLLLRRGASSRDKVFVYSGGEAS